MKKIPVGAAIAHAYRFTFGRFTDLLRLLWLPGVASAACNYFGGGQMTVLIQGLRTHDFSGLTMPWPLVILVTVAAFLFTNMMITAAYQLALGRIDARGRWFYLPLGKPLWQVTGAFLVLILTIGVLLVVYLLAALVVGIVFNLGFHAAHMSETAIKLAAVLDFGLAFLVGYCGAIFCLVRFGFLLFPATIADGRIGLFRAWQISHGNFWRALGTGLAVILPLLVMEIGILAGFGIFHLPPSGATPEQVQAMQAASAAATTTLTHHYWYLFYPGMTLVLFITYGLLAGAQSFSWQALTDDSSANRP